MNAFITGDSMCHIRKHLQAHANIYFDTSLYKLVLCFSRIIKIPKRACVVMCARTQTCTIKHAHTCMNMCVYNIYDIGYTCVRVC